MNSRGKAKENDENYETQNTRNSGLESNPRPPKYEGVSTTRPRRSVPNIEKLFLASYYHHSVGWCAQHMDGDRNIPEKKGATVVMYRCMS
jgi:hypothetical protein